MASQLDPNVPPHKTWPFWYIVALALLVAIGYPLAAPSHGSLLSNVVPSIVTFIMMVCVGWFAVRRAQRGQTGPSMRGIVLVVIGIILIVLSYFLRHRP